MASDPSPLTSRTARATGRHVQRTEHYVGLTDEERHSILAQPMRCGFIVNTVDIRNVQLLRIGLYDVRHGGWMPLFEWPNTLQNRIKADMVCAVYRHHARRAG